MENKYALYLNEEQAKVVLQALDLFSRIHMGQVEEVDAIIRLYGINQKTKDLDGMKNAMAMFKKAAFPELSSTSYHGINSSDIDDNARVAWDIQQVLRNVIAWHKTPQGGMTVDFDVPMRSSEKQHLPEADVIKDRFAENMLLALKEKFAYYTEVEMATLESAEMKKTTSKSDIKRHKKIVDDMIDICRGFHIVPKTTTPRLKAILHDE